MQYIEIRSPIWVTGKDGVTYFICLTVKFLF